MAKLLHLLARRETWVYVLLVVSFSVYAYSKCDRSGRPARPFPEDRAEVESITLRRQGDSLSLRREGSRWLLPDGQSADTGQVARLLNLLASVHLDLPLDTTPPTDSGLQVRITTPTQRIAYTLTPLDSLRLLLRFDGGRGFSAQLPGHRPETARYLSLAPGDWASHQLGIARPSLLRYVRVDWLPGLGTGFTLTLDEHRTGRLLGPNEGTGPQIPLTYDTARVSCFLHSLTELRYQPQGDSLSPELYLRLARERPYFQLHLELRDGAQLDYQIHSLDTNARASLPPPRYAYLLHQDQVYLIRLMDWDASLISLQDLLGPEKP